jgi:hypothetical protein
MFPSVRYLIWCSVITIIMWCSIVRYLIWCSVITIIMWCSIVRYLNIWQCYIKSTIWQRYIT